jgi:hypothetical protein
MSAIRSSIVELSQQCHSAWHRTISFGERLAGNPVVYLRAKPDILRLDGQVLQASPLDSAWREHVDDLIADWRDSGLEVSLIEHLSTPTAPGTYVLTVCSETLALICTCQSWSDLATKEPVWTIGVSVRPVEQRITGSAGVGPLRHLGMAASPKHEAVWQIIIDWLDSHESFDPDVLDMLGPAMPAVEASSEESTPEQSAPPHLLLFGGTSIMAVMIVMLFLNLGSERKPDQTAELSSSLIGAGLSVSEPDDHYGDVQDVRATPASSSPSALAPDSPMYAEKNPPAISVFEAHELKPEVQLDYAADPPATLHGVNEPVLQTATINSLPPPSPTLVASAPPVLVSQTVDPSALTSTLPDVSISPPALLEKTGVSLAVTLEPTDKPAIRSSARRSPPLPQVKPSNPIISNLALAPNSPSPAITSQETTSVGSRIVNTMENTLTKPPNHLEQQRRGPVPLVAIARPEYAVQVAAVTTPAAAPRVWLQTMARFPSLGDLRLLEPAPVEVGDKGRRLLYRVAAGTFKQRETAEAVCSKVRARAGECLVISY